MSKYEFIDSQKAEPANLNSVVRMCRWLAVLTSGFYHWATRAQSATPARRQALTARIRHYFEESEGTYGYRRIRADLAAEQTECSPELVRQIMRYQGLVPVNHARSASPPRLTLRQPRACPTSSSGTSPPTAPG
ncbi:hypothetical protein QFZ79_001436 [Arthrobacter sp. V4I6]|nr:hypothetical protein [Arthrobacter sp. V1I7]MDQ0853325.1 hypothetical protein [Arthrobacter sp. V4I6]